MISQGSYEGNDNSPIDADGAILINGATVFAAGNAGVDGTLKDSSFSGQSYYQSRTSYAANQVINIYAGSALLHSETLPKAVSYVMYTQAGVTESLSLQPSSDTSANTGNTSETSTGTAASATSTASVTAVSTTSNAVSLADKIKTITAKSTDGDISGSSYNPLKLKSTKQTNGSVKLSYSKVSGAVKYVILGNTCGGKYKVIKTTSKTSLTIKKLAGKAIKKGTYYKFLVLAVDSDGNVISTSKTIHAATKGGKVGNTKKITIKNLSSLKKAMSVGATKTVNAKLVNPTGVTVKKHTRIRYESSDTSVATVNSKGKITAKGKGACYIYVYAQNGVTTKVKITVE